MNEEPETENILIGSCFCRSVTFQLPANSAGIIVCHCEDCRKMHGNFNAMIGVFREEIIITSVKSLRWFESSATTRRGFCENCGSRLFKDIYESNKLMVCAGSIDGKTHKTIIKNLWINSKADWYELPRTAEVLMQS